MAFDLTPEHGRRGGFARAKAMSKHERSESASKAAKARWKKRDEAQKKVSEKAAS